MSPLLSRAQRNTVKEFAQAAAAGAALAIIIAYALIEWAVLP